MESKRAWFRGAVIAAGALTVSGCGGDAATTNGSGGLTGVAGELQSNGGNAAGGDPAKGGTTGSGGSQTAGGAGTTAAGGSAARGGATASAGAQSTGGRASGGSSGQPTGGSSLGSGGALTGGAHSTGGLTGSGGAGTAGDNAGGSVAAAGVGGGGAVPVWPKKFCGNITTSSKADPPNLTFADHWDQITPENAGKWAAVQASISAAFNWTVLDTIYAYAEQHGIPFKEHTFVTGGAQPAGQYTTAHVENWIKAYCGRYPKTALIDVVNEPPPHTTPTYASVLGQGESGSYPWIVKSFKLARQYCGSAVLILNDYDNLAYATSQAHYIDIVNDVLANGGPVDALGVEAHDALKMTTIGLQAALDTLSSKTGLPIYITEYDVGKVSDAEQLAIYQEQFPIFWQSSAVRGVTLWGWIVGSTWISNTGLVKDTEPRLAMSWLMEYLGRPTPK